MAELGFSLALLGAPVVRRIEPGGRGVEVKWRLRRALQVVAFLALKPDRRVDKDELVDAVWPEATAEAVAKNFHPTLSDVRRTLGGRRQERRRAIVYVHGIYALSPEIDWDVDVERFRHLLAEGGRLRQAAPEEALETWSAAWKLYRGPLMTGSEGPWIDRWREDLRRDYLILLSGIGRLAAELERDLEALDAYRSVLLREPYEERVHMAVMELYAKQGRRDLVRRQYVRLQELLKELDVGPLEETQSCYHRLMR